MDTPVCDLTQQWVVVMMLMSRKLETQGSKEKYDQLSSFADVSNDGWAAETEVGSKLYLIAGNLIGCMA
jgi:hypothetical protein